MKLRPYILFIAFSIFIHYSTPQNSHVADTTLLVSVDNKRQTSSNSPDILPVQPVQLPPLGQIDSSQFAPSALNTGKNKGDFSPVAPVTGVNSTRPPASSTSTKANNPNTKTETTTQKEPKEPKEPVAVETGNKETTKSVTDITPPNQREDPQPNGRTDAKREPESPAKSETTGDTGTDTVKAPTGEQTSKKDTPKNPVDETLPPKDSTPSKKVETPSQPATPPPADTNNGKDAGKDNKTGETVGNDGTGKKQVTVDPTPGQLPKLGDGVGVGNGNGNGTGNQIEEPPKVEDPKLGKEAKKEEQPKEPQPADPKLGDDTKKGEPIEVTPPKKEEPKLGDDAKKGETEVSQPKKEEPKLGDDTKQGDQTEVTQPKKEEPKLGDDTTQPPKEENNGAKKEEDLQEPGAKKEEEPKQGEGNGKQEPKKEAEKEPTDNQQQPPKEIPDVGGIIGDILPGPKKGRDDTPVEPEPIVLPDPIGEVSPSPKSEPGPSILPDPVVILPPPATGTDPVVIPDPVVVLPPPKSETSPVVVPLPPKIDVGPVVITPPPKTEPNPVVVPPQPKVEVSPVAPLPAPKIEPPVVVVPLPPKLDQAKPTTPPTEEPKSVKAAAPSVTSFDSPAQPQKTPTETLTISDFSLATHLAIPPIPKIAEAETATLTFTNAFGSPTVIVVQPEEPLTLTVTDALGLPTVIVIPRKLAAQQKGEASPGSFEETQSNSSSGTTGIIVGVVATGLVIIGGVFMLITRRRKQAFKILMDSRSDDADDTTSDISIEHPNLASSPITSNFDSHLASKATSKTPSVVDLPAPTISAESTLDRETKSHLLWKAWRRVKYGSVAPSTVFTTRTRTSFRDSFVSRQSHVSLSTIAPLVEGEDNIFGRGITPSMSASNLGDPDVLERFKNLETNATLKSDYSDRIPQIPDLPSIPDLAEYEDILVSSLKYESAPRRRSRSLGSQESYRHRPERQRPRSTSAPSNLDNDSVSVTMEKTFPRQIYIPPPSPLRIQSMFPDSEVFGYSGSPTSSALFESDPASPCSIVDMAFFESTNDSDIPSVDRGLPEVPSRDY